MTYSDQVRAHLSRADAAQALAARAHVSARNALEDGDLRLYRLWSAHALTCELQADAHRADAARANWRASVAA